MMKDKKNTSQKINLILLKKIGSTIIKNQYDIAIIRKFLKRRINQSKFVKNEYSF